jgi:hypothetical protein
LCGIKLFINKKSSLLMQSGRQASRTILIVIGIQNKDLLRETSLDLGLKIWDLVPNECGNLSRLLYNNSFNP